MKIRKLCETFSSSMVQEKGKRQKKNGKRRQEIRRYKLISEWRRILLLIPF